MEGGKFGFEFTSPRDGKTYITTKDATFVMMDKYLQLDLVLPSRRIYGLGERNREFTLTEGTYTMWATHDNHDYDDGRRGGKQTYGVHPFALVQTATAGEFLGIYFRNSDAMSPIVRYTDNDTATLSLITIGGDIEAYFFFKGTAKQIIAQYQNLVGKPALPPVWALGWHHSGFWKSLGDVQAFVGNMTKKKLPLEGLWLDKYMGRGNQFSVNSTTYPNINAWAAQLKSQGTKLVSVLRATLHSDDPRDMYYSGALQSDALIKSTINQDRELGVLTNRDEGVDVVYPDFFENRAKGVWQQGLEDLQDTLPYDGVYLRKNSPYGYCSGECPSPQFAGGAAKGAELGNETKQKHGWWSSYDKQEEASTYELPFIPGEDENLDFITASLNSTHPSNNLTEFDLHSLFGHAQGKLTYEILRESMKDKLPFVFSESTFAGSGQYMGHQFENYQLGWNNLEQQISGMMNLNMFGIQLSGPDVYTFNISKQKTYPDVAARWTQFAAFNPFAKVDSQYDGVLGPATPLYSLKEPYFTDVLKAMYERLSFTHLFYTCLFQAHDEGHTCYDPLLFHYPENDRVFERDKTEKSVMVADSIMVSPVLTTPRGGTFGVYYPNDENGVWVNLRTWKGTSVDPASQGEVVQVPDSNVDVQLRPGRIIPWVDNSAHAYNTTQQVLDSNRLSLVVNRDARGHAEGRLYLGDGVSQSQLEAKTYEYYQFKFGGQSLKKWNLNEGRQDTGKALKEVRIAHAADLADVDFACVTSEVDHSVTYLDTPFYDADSQVLTLSRGAGIPLFNMKDIHFGKTGRDLNMCNLESHYYVMGAVDKGAQLWTIAMHSHQPASTKDVYLEIRQFANNVINLQWVVTDYQNQIFKVPDSLIGFDRSAKVDINDKLIEFQNFTVNGTTSTRIIVKNEKGVALYALNGFVMNHDHFNYFDVSLMTDG